MSARNWPDNEAPVFEGANTITVDSVATGTTAGLTLQNTTAATGVATVQRSPSSWLYGTAWDSDDSVSRVYGMGWQVRPASGATVTGELELMRDLAGSVADTGFAFGDGYMRFGTSNYPTSGSSRIRFPHNNIVLTGALSGTSTACDLFSWGTGGHTNGLRFGSSGVTAIRYYCVDGTNTALYMDGTEVQFGRALVQFGAATASPVFGHEDRGASGAVTAMRIKSQGTTQASTASGDLSVDIGRPGSGGASGLGRLRAVRSNNSTFDEALAWSSSGSAPTLGFYGAAPAAKPTVTGSRGANAALADLLTELATLGLLTDSSSA